MTDPIVIIGAGIGGLTAAALLAAEGHAVTVCETAATPGGKLREVIAGGRTIDAGPTVFTMRWVFDEIFAAAGTTLADHLTLTPVTTLARHAWDGDGGHLDLFAGLAASGDAIAAFAGPAEAVRFRAFMAEATRTYATLRDTFLTAPATSPLGLTRRIGLTRPGDLLSIRPFETLWRALGRYFHDPRLRQLFGRYATYSGASPFQCPATLMLIAHVEADGVWAVTGGMHRIARALEALATRHGAVIRYAAPVAGIAVGGAGAEGVVLASGERIAARAVIVNADPQAVATGLFGAAAAAAVPAFAPRDRSLSAVTWTLAAPTSGFALDHHNVFFSNDYAAEFADLAAGRLPRHPSVYVCAADRGTGGTGHAAEALHMIVNAPATGAALDQGAIDACETATFALLDRCGLTVERTAAATVRTTPAGFATMFPATGGALYGRASHGWQASFRRPGAATRIPGLFLAGGATHPGAGVPMAALSGRLAAAAVIASRR
jgi:1-hydroxycarotenoid 3,4-desaturase